MIHTQNISFRVWLLSALIVMPAGLQAGQSLEHAEDAHAEQAKTEARERAHDYEVQRQAKTIFQSVADRFNIEPRSACAAFIKRVKVLERVKSVTCSQQKKSAAVLLQSGALLRFRL